MHVTGFSNIFLHYFYFWFVFSLEVKAYFEALLRVVFLKYNVGFPNTHQGFVFNDMIICFYPFFTLERTT